MVLDEPVVRINKYVGCSLALFFSKKALDLISYKEITVYIKDNYLTIRESNIDDYDSKELNFPRIYLDEYKYIDFIGEYLLEEDNQEFILIPIK